MDFAAPIADIMLLIIVDAYSKWLEVKPMPSTTSGAVITVLDELFSAYGIPITIVSDNGPQFTSQELETFLKEKGVGLPMALTMGLSGTSGLWILGSP
ncbi:hypothetical protein HUJ04_005368 [Dendroctonus ponderosae]|nr:hypothetical protein HUJ04_005368 [Dendroctonus ponderosae]